MGRGGFGSSGTSGKGSSKGGKGGKKGGGKEGEKGPSPRVAQLPRPYEGYEQFGAGRPEDAIILRAAGARFSERTDPSIRPAAWIYVGNNAGALCLRDPDGTGVSGTTCTGGTSRRSMTGRTG